MTLGYFLLTLGAVARLTRLITDDIAMRWFRARIVGRYGRDHKLSTLVTCPWCLSIWIVGPVIAAQQLATFHGWDLWFILPAAGLSITWLIGIGASWLDGAPPAAPVDLLAKALPHVRAAGDEQLAAQLTGAIAEASK